MIMNVIFALIMKKIVVNYGKAPNLMNIDKDLANNE